VAASDRQEINDLSDNALGDIVTVRGQPLKIDATLLRSLAHTAYHVGQIVYLAKSIRGDEWRCLSIPKGMSEAGVRDRRRHCGLRDS
jgi:hypothetical protein